jgi:hypothetical protein
MKTERRHELQTNILADWMGHQIEHLRPYSKALFFGLGAIVVVILVGLYMVSDQAARVSAGWSDYYAASFEQNPERLRSVAMDHAGTDAALWAKLSEADLQLARGIGLLYSNRTAAAESLERAEANYRNVERDATSQADLRVSALFGLAQTCEATSDVDDAKNHYGDVIRLAPDSARAREAEERVATLSDPEIVRFYNWFANQKPQPPTALGGLPPGLNIPSDFPMDLGGLTDTPDFDFLSGGVSDSSESEPTEAAAPTEAETIEADGSETEPGPALNPSGGEAAGNATTAPESGDQR